MEEIREVSLREMIKNNYKIDLLNNEYERLVWTLNNYNIQPTELSFSMQSSDEMYINALSTVKNIDFKRSSLNLELEDVIFELFPIAHHYSEKINTIYPKHINVEHKDSGELPKDNFEYNIAIVRHMEIRVHNQDSETITTYTMVIYNKDANIVAGIIFN